MLLLFLFYLSCWIMRPHIRIHNSNSYDNEIILFLNVQSNTSKGDWWYNKLLLLLFFFSFLLFLLVVEKDDHSYNNKVVLVLVAQTHRKMQPPTNWQVITDACCYCFFCCFFLFFIYLSCQIKRQKRKKFDKVRYSTSYDN